MERVAVDDVEPRAIGDGSHSRGLSDPLGTTGLAINRYRIVPGEGFPSGLHAHADQEEVFVVLEGEATFETMAGEVTVGENEAIRFAPGEFQSGRNEISEQRSAANQNSKRSGDADRDLVVLALGAPRDSEDVRIPVECPDCRHGNVRLDAGGDRLAFVCPHCGAEHVPADCPDCGSDDLYVTLDEALRTIVVCENCGSEFDRPPLRT